MILVMVALLDRWQQKTPRARADVHEKKKPAFLANAWSSCAIAAKDGDENKFQTEAVHLH